MNLDKSLADIFVEEGLVSSQQLHSILAARTDTRESVGDLLVRLGTVSERSRLRCVGMQMGVPFIELENAEIDLDATKIVPHAVAIRLLAIPIERTDTATSVAMVNPLDLAALDELQAVTGLDVDPILSTEEDVREAIFRSFGAYDDLGEIVGEAVRGADEELRIAGVDDEEEALNVIELKEAVEGAPVIKLANALLVRAITMRSSDVHIEPHQRRVRIRFRIDGMLQEVMAVPKDLQQPLVSRIKILAGLDIAERRMPQDGRCTLIAPQGEFDFRVSTYPCVHGENVVIRILDKNAKMLDLTKIGMSDGALNLLQARLADPQGLILVTGPTGSGKTTTLYAAINQLNAVHRNIITVEDPVEYQLDGVVQGNINNRAGITFATGLRSILRQDPDVILVGEVRDEETASIAIEASLTGHLVLTSLHSNDSAAAILRLIDMGIEPFLLASSVSCSVAQRLVRIICPKCAETYKPDELILSKLSLPSDFEYKKGRGCEYCAKTGYRGRSGLYEVLHVTADVRRLILSGKHSSEVRDYAESNGMDTIRTDGREKILQGVTTVEEVIRVTTEGS